MFYSYALSEFRQIELCLLFTFDKLIVSYFQKDWERRGQGSLISHQNEMNLKYFFLHLISINLFYGFNNYNKLQLLLLLMIDDYFYYVDIYFLYCCYCLWSIGSLKSPIISLFRIADLKLLHRTTFCFTICNSTFISFVDHFCIQDRQLTV